MADAFVSLLGPMLEDVHGQAHSTANVLAGKDFVALLFTSIRFDDPPLFSAVLDMNSQQVVYVSLDTEEEWFKKSRSYKSCLALPFQDARLKAKELIGKYGVDTQDRDNPQFVVLDATGEVVTTKGWDKLEAGEDLFPKPAGAIPIEEVTSEMFENAGAKHNGPPPPGNAEFKDIEAPWAEMLTRRNTVILMQERKTQGPVAIVCIVWCCWWIPLLFFLGAANVLPTCESDSFSTWLRLYGIVPLGAALFGSIIVTIAAWVGHSATFKMAEKLKFIIGGVVSAIGLPLFIWGWVEYSKTSDAWCVGLDDVNPRELTLAWLIISTIGLCCGCCLGCVAIALGGAAILGGMEPSDTQ